MQFDGWRRPSSRARPRQHVRPPLTGSTTHIYDAHSAPPPTVQIIPLHELTIILERTRKVKVRPRSKRQRRAKSKATSNGSVHVARLPPKKDVVANAHTSLAYMIKKRVEIRKKRKSEWKRRTDEARTTSIASIASTTKQTAPRGTTTVAKIGIPTRGAAVPTAPALHRNTHFL